MNRDRPRDRAKVASCTVCVIDLIREKLSQSLPELSTIPE